MGRPLLDYWLSHLGDAGIRHIGINSHAHPDQMDDYLYRVRRRAGFRLRVSFEPVLLGSAGTLAASRKLLSSSPYCVVIYADNLSDIDIGAMCRFHEGHDHPITVALNQPDDLRTCGVAVLDESGVIVDFQEKPQQPRSKWANAGIYIFDREVLDELGPTEIQDIGKDLLPRYAGRMQGWCWGGDSMDIGTAARYSEALRQAPHVLGKRGFDAAGRRAAVFLDRDGTLIEPIHYLRDPAGVRLLPLAARSIRRLRQAGFATVVVTNQSAVGRGLMSEAELRDVNRRVCDLLAEQGAVLDAIYYSTAVPHSGDRTIVEHPDRKPGHGLIQGAGTDLCLDLGSSWIIGDMISDALAGRNANLAGSVLVKPDNESPGALPEARQFPSFDRIDLAVDFILEQSALRRAVG